MKEVQEVKRIEKLAVTFRTVDDMYIFSENEKERPELVGRAGSMKDLLRVIGEVTGHEIRIEEHFGDYLYKVLSGDKK
jgi:hypothetical protein